MLPTTCLPPRSGPAMAHSGGMARSGVPSLRRASPRFRLHLRLLRRRPDRGAVPVRLIAAAAVAAALALPTNAVAAPSPSPRLETLLADPPASDFREDASLMAIHGTFDAHQYVQFLGPQN